MASIAIRGIRKSFGETPVLRDLSLDVAEGEFVTLVGPSGCGKSTLLRIIAGLELQDAGAVEIAGRRVDTLPPKQRDVAMVFQSYALYPYMTVAGNIALPLVMRRMSALQRLPVAGRLFGAGKAQAGIAAEVREVAELLDIADLLARKPGQLSGGQKQRVALGRAMVRHPQVFLMDEPLANLDAKLRVQMRAEIAQLHRRLATTFLYVTHDQAEAMTMSDRVAVMIKGRLLQVAPPRSLYEDPEDLRVAEFIGSPKINVLAGLVRQDGGIEVDGQALPLSADLPANTPVSVAIRAESLELARAAGAWEGRVFHTEHLGHEVFLHVRLQSGQGPLIIRVPGDEPGLADVNATVWVRPRRGRVMVFDNEGRRVRPRNAAENDHVVHRVG